MPLAGFTKSELVARAYSQYSEVAGQGFFSTAMMGTFAQNAVREFAVQSQCVIGSSRKARPTASSGEAVLTLPTGLFSPWRVIHERHFGSSGKVNEVEYTSESRLGLWYGGAWLSSSEATVGTSPNTHRWYRRDHNALGFFPPVMTATAGTAVVWSFRVPTAMSTSTADCGIPAQYAPGVIALMCKQMAERDVDADPDGGRMKGFDGDAQSWAQIARTETRQAYGIED